MNNALAEHAHPSLPRIWSDGVNVALERAWWVSVMEAQQALGLDIPNSAIAQSRAMVTVGNSALTLMRIRQRERIVKHDLKARLEVFCEHAGHEYHHLGLTSADVVENTWQIRIRDSLTLLAQDYGLPYQTFPLRGVHGPVGTDQDQLDLLGSADAVHSLNRRLCERWHFPDYARSVPQTMHRSQDLEVLGPVASETGARLARAGAEGRLWKAVINGYLSMIAGYQGDTWNEGDVSSSVVRRVAIPNLIFAVSAAHEVLNLEGVAWATTVLN